MNKPLKIKQALISIWIIIGLTIINLLINKWTGNISINEFVFMLLITGIICIIPYKIANKSNPARFIFTLFIMLNLLILIADMGKSMLIIDIIFTVLCIPLYIYSLIKLYSENSNDWFKNIEVNLKNSNSVESQKGFPFIDKNNDEIFKPIEKRKYKSNLSFEEKLQKKDKEYQNKYQDRKEFKPDYIKEKPITYIEKKEKGDDYETKVAGYYKLDGYSIYLNGIKKGIKDGGIDVICKKDDIVLLIQCKNWNGNNKYKIDHEKVKAFHSNCIRYIDENNLSKVNTKLIYAVPNKNIFEVSAIEVFKDEYYNCRYEILKF